MIIITSVLKKYAPVFTVFFIGFVFFTNVKNTNLAVKSALIFCFENLVPSIFIYMVFFSFLLYLCDFSGILSKCNNSLFRLLGICKKYFFEVLLCSVCGFVSGAKIISEKFKKIGGSEVEFSNAVILSSNAGVGFLVGCVGVKIWDSAIFGVYLFFSQILISILLGRLILKHPKFNDTALILPHHNSSFSSAFCRAVSTSSLTIISMCAFVVVFSCFSGNLFSLFRIKKDSPLYLTVSIILEFSQGIFLSASYGDLVACAFMTGFCVGFGGLCVHFQIFSTCEGLPLDKMRFIIFKLFHGVLCGFSSLIYVLASGIEPSRLAINILDTKKICIGLWDLIFIFATTFTLFLILRRIFLKILLILR